MERAQKRSRQYQLDPARCDRWEISDRIVWQNKLCVTAATLMTAQGQIRTSASAVGVSASDAEAVVSRLKTDIAVPRAAVAGRADVRFAGCDFRS